MICVQKLEYPPWKESKQKFDLSPQIFNPPLSVTTSSTHETHTAPTFTSQPSQTYAKRGSSVSRNPLMAELLSSDPLQHPLPLLSSDPLQNPLPTDPLQNSLPTTLALDGVLTSADAQTTPKRGSKQTKAKATASRKPTRSPARSATRSVTPRGSRSGSSTPRGSRASTSTGDEMPPPPPLPLDYVNHTMEERGVIRALDAAGGPSGHPSGVSIQTMQKKDKVLRKLFKIVQSGEIPPLTQERDPELKTYLKRIRKIKIKDNILYRDFNGKDLPILPITEYPKLFELYHLPSHLSPSKMTQNILQSFYLYDMNRILRLAVANCDICRKRGEGQVGQAPFFHLYAGAPNDKIYIDLVGRFPQRSQEGYFYILNILDAFSKHLTSIPIRTNHSDLILEKLTSQYFHIYGFCKELVSDNAPEFTSKVFTDFFTKIGIKHTLIPAYHPRSNGAIERVQKTVKNYLSKLTHERGWRQTDLQSCVFNYNSSTHTSLKETPYFLRFSQDPLIEATLLYRPELASNQTESKDTKIIVENHRRKVMAQNYLFSSFEKTRQLKPQTWKNTDLMIGDPVLVRNFRQTHKSEPKFLNGFTITDVINQNTYLVRNNDTDKISRLHVGDLKIDQADPYFMEKEISRIRTEQKDDSTHREEDTDDLDESSINEPQQTDQ